MYKLRLLFGILFAMYITSAKACKYTIREIGFSTLSKVTYTLYRVNANSSNFPSQEALRFSNSNIKTLDYRLKDEENNSIADFVKQQNLSLPAYVLVDANGRMLSLSTKTTGKTVSQIALFSKLQNEMLAELPQIYGSVLLVEGNNYMENQLAKEMLLKTCERIENVMPNMPKQVDEGPNLKVISKVEFDEEKVLLWSLGIEIRPEHPIAFVLYGKGRVMGEKINFSQIKEDDVYKHLSIIGADCECGLDRKWLLGYQVPLDWPKKIRQGLTNNLGFDVDNPMILTEMSRILAIENKAPKDPDGISFEPVVINLEDEFDDVPVIKHEKVILEDDKVDIHPILIYSLIAFALIIVVGVVFVLRKKQ